MRFTGTHSYPFDDTNRAYRRFLDIASEHFNVLGWTTDDGRPALTTLLDLQTGDAFTVAIVDSHEEPLDPYTLLVVDRDGALSAHGCFDGPAAADAYAPRLVLHHGAITATKPTALRPCGETHLQADAWQAVPSDMAARLHADPPADGPTVLILLIELDRTTTCLTAVGPFCAPDAAVAWQPDNPPGAAVTRMLVALHPGSDTGNERSEP
jgi:hypothetical protein